jgi:ABC-type sulfate transport system substrate-binding protein
VVDANAEKHCVAPIAAAFVKYLPAEAQDVFQSVGYQRPISVAAARRAAV